MNHQNRTYSVVCVCVIRQFVFLFYQVSINIYVLYIIYSCVVIFFWLNLLCLIYFGKNYCNIFIIINICFYFKWTQILSVFHSFHLFNNIYAFQFFNKYRQINQYEFIFGAQTTKISSCWIHCACILTFNSLFFSFFLFISRKITAIVYSIK